MKIRIFAVPAHGGRSAENELNQFLSNKRIVSIDKHFVENGSHGYWTFCIIWTEEREEFPSRKEKIDYKQVLSEKDFSLYAKLRELRKKLADQEGVPAYALFTNEQLAEIVKQKVVSKSALAAIKGVGAARVEKYGTQFIELIKTATDSDSIDETKQNKTDTNR